MKTVMFKFVDGLKEVRVGQEVYVGSNGRTSHAYTGVITAIGSKYISIGRDDRGINVSQYDILSGKKKSQYQGEPVYSSEEAFKRIKLEQEDIEKVYTWFNDNIYGGTKLNHKQALAIMEILKGNDQPAADSLKVSQPEAVKGATAMTVSQVKSVHEKTGCGMMMAKFALELREGVEELAIEYVQRSGLAVMMSDETRFPRWTEYKRGAK